MCIWYFCMLLLLQARLFGPAMFEAHKLKVLYLGEGTTQQHPAQAPTPRMYTLTHSDVTAKITLAVAHHFNHSQVSRGLKPPGVPILYGMVLYPGHYAAASWTCAPIGCSALLGNEAGRQRLQFQLCMHSTEHDCTPVRWIHREV